jgi:uncharacterized protein YdhG (YjbR/CyaY superfamily)
MTATHVDEYLAALPEHARVALEALRLTIRAAAPTATEVISYQMPAFRDGDLLLVSYAAFKDHGSFFPMSKAVIEANEDALRKHVSGKGTLRFAYDDPIPDAVVKTIVEARLSENAERRARRKR